MVMGGLTFLSAARDQWLTFFKLDQWLTFFYVFLT